MTARAATARPRLTPVFRTAIRTDLPALANLDAAACPVPTWTALRFDREVRSPQQFVAVVEDDRGQPAYRSGPLAGYCVCRLDSWQIVVRRLAVAPAYRRLGVGRLMLAKVKDMLQPDHRSRVQVAVDERNLPAQQWLRAVGFVAYATEQDGDGARYLFSFDLPGTAVVPVRRR